MIGGGAKVSVSLKGPEGSTQPFRYAGEFQGEKGPNLLWLCCMWVPKSPSYPDWWKEKSLRFSVWGLGKVHNAEGHSRDLLGGAV